MLARSPLRRYGKAAARRKYKNQHTEYNGALYHSAMEARYAALLDLRVKAYGPMKIESWRRQVSIPLEVNGVLICKYVADFEITHTDGRLETVEVKGLETDTWRLKHALFRAIYPHRRLTVVKDVR